MKRKRKRSHPLSGGYYIYKTIDQFKVRTALFYKLFDINILNNKISISEIFSDGSVDQIGQFTKSDFLNELTPCISIESSFNHPQIAMALHLAIHGALNKKVSPELIDGWP